MPGWSIGHRRYERPWCDVDSGSVRHTTKHQSARCANVVHTFWPVITHSSPSSTARVWMLARSDPALGSENPWHHSSSTDWIFGRNRRFCSSVPNWISVGANRPSPKNETRAGALARAYSSLKITCCANGSARPPYSSGHDIPTQRSAPSTRSHSRRTSQPVSSAGPPPEPSAANSPVRCSASHARTSARKAASSVVSRKSMAARTLLDRPVRFLGREGCR